MHPRHPPRGASARAATALSARCAAFPRTSPAGQGARAALYLWGGRHPPPSFGLRFAVCVRCPQCRTDFIFRHSPAVRLFVPSASALAQPPPRFHTKSRCVAFACRFNNFVWGRQSPSLLAALAKPPRGRRRRNSLPDCCDTIYMRIIHTHIFKLIFKSAYNAGHKQRHLLCSSFCFFNLGVLWCVRQLPCVP